jgi:hypothetical protein
MREWWNGNRETLKPEELTAMQAQHERVHDLLDWMELCGHENEGLDFVSVEETIADVVESLLACSNTRTSRALRRRKRTSRS